MIYLQLFYEFFKIGLFAVGGGTATIPFLQRLGEASGWFTHADLIDMIAVGESAPGPLGIELATYVGFNTGSNPDYGGMGFLGGVPGGVLGSVCAILGIIAPSIIIILIVAYFYDRFRKSKIVNDMFYTLRPASAGMIYAAASIVLITAVFDGLLTVDNNGIAARISFTVTTASVLHTLTLLALAALCGAILYIKPKINPLIIVGISAAAGVALSL